VHSPSKQNNPDDLSREVHLPIVLVINEAVEAARLTRLLNLAGYATTTAADGTEALAKATLEHPDLVLCEINLPGLDARELCRGLRAVDALAGMAIILLSSDPLDLATALRELQAVADECLEAPYDYLKLIARVALHIERRQNERVLRLASDELLEKVEARTIDLLKANSALRAEVEQREAAAEALHETEGRYRRFLDNSPDAIFVHVAKEIVFANHAALELSGAANQQQLACKTPLHLIRPDSQASAKQNMRELWREGREITHTEGKFIKLDGSVIDVDVCVKPFVYKSKTCVQTTVREISERKSDEELLRASVALELRRKKTRIAIDLTILATLVLVFLTLHFNRVFESISLTLVQDSLLEANEFFVAAVFVILMLAAFYLRGAKGEAGQ